MMAVPFATALVAVYLAWKDRRRAAVAVALLALVITAVLFRLHATDALGLAL